LGRWSGGGTPSKNNATFWGGDIAWISPKDVKSAVITATEDRVSHAGLRSSPTELLPPDAVVVVVRSGILRRTLPVATTATEACVNQDLKALVPAVGVHSRFVYYALRRFEREVLQSCAKQGVTVESIEVPRLLRFAVPLAPLAEQRRIVAAIEEQFTRLDAAVTALEHVRANLRRYRASVLNAACSGRLVPTEAAAWTRSVVSEIAEVQGGIQKQPKRAPRVNAYPYLRVANVLRGRLDLAHVERMELFGNELDRLRLEPGDLLIVEGNGSPSEIGRMAVWDGSIANCVHQNHIIRVRCNPTVDPRYISAYWNSLNGAETVRRVASSTSGLHTLSVAKISNIQVPYPPLSEQQRIVAEVERRLSLADKLDVVAADAFKRAAALRQSILKRAFEGRLVPQNPDDEPAGVLLARIRAERAAQATNGAEPKRRGRAKARR